LIINLYSMDYWEVTKGSFKHWATWTLCLHLTTNNKAIGWSSRLETTNFSTRWQKNTNDQLQSCNNPSTERLHQCWATKRSISKLKLRSCTWFSSRKKITILKCMWRYAKVSVQKNIYYNYVDQPSHIVVECIV
jgi:hypothetical protein